MKVVNLKLILVYTSDKLKEQQYLQEFVVDRLQGNKYILYIRQNSNTQIGISNKVLEDDEPKNSYIGKFRIDKRYAKGEQLVEFL